MTLLIRGGRVIDPAHGVDTVLDLLAEGGVVTRVGRNLPLPPGAQLFDARGKLVVPGLIDLHCHLREPGFTHKETVATGTRAAVMGGFTAVVAMANTNPVVDNTAVVSLIRKRAQESKAARVYPMGALTKGSHGEELTAMAGLKEAGVVAFSDDGHPVMNAGVMRHALEYAGMFDLPVVAHCEDKNLAGDGVMHEGRYATALGLAGMPAVAEEVMVARDLLLAGLTGARLHLAHVSTRGSVDLIRDARKRGVKVSAEVTPHHLTLTEAAVGDYDTNAKVNPPLREHEDLIALRRALADGIIDVVATDHAPHAPVEKDVEFDQAPFGISGLETALPLLVTELVLPGYLSWMHLIRVMATNPARIFNLPGGDLGPGSPADLTVIDPDMELVVDPVAFQSRGKNTPLAGRRLRGWPVATVVGGKVIMEERQLKVTGGEGL